MRTLLFSLIVLTSVAQAAITEEQFQQLESACSSKVGDVQRGLSDSVDTSIVDDGNGALKFLFTKTSAADLTTTLKVEDGKEWCLEESEFSNGDQRRFISISNNSTDSAFKNLLLEKGVMDGNRFSIAYTEEKSSPEAEVNVSLNLKMSLVVDIQDDGCRMYASAIDEAPTAMVDGKPIVVEGAYRSNVISAPAKKLTKEELRQIDLSDITVCEEYDTGASNCRDNQNLSDLLN
jgi:hypothetical protein